MNLSKTLIAAAVAMTLTVLPRVGPLAQGQPPAVTASEIPQEIIAALASSPRISTVYSVSGHIRFDGQVLKVDELVFQPNSTLEFIGADFPFRAIVARRIRFADPQAPAAIVRDRTLKAPTGENQSNGINGEEGGSLDLPPMYIYAERIEAVGVNGPLGRAQLTIDFRGVPGGQGGRGEDGSTGTRGQNGRQSSSGPLSCNRGAGDGGAGGPGSAGGDGGRGGDGGDGSDIYLISNAAGVDMLSASILRTNGGTGGAGGPAGRGGSGGPGGRGGNGSRHCGGGDIGPTGPAGPNGNAGARGEVGRAGDVRAIRSDNLPVF